MQSKLEEILKDKERELKLYQRFIDLQQYCEESIFPSIDLPLKQHIEDLKRLVEEIIPDPKDRTEEMFSGEIFALLGTIYLHDTELVKDREWSPGRNIPKNLNDGDDGQSLNYRIGEKLDIPETAVEIINYLSFTDILKRIPLEWSIVEDGRKAIIRNARVIGYAFNFAHILLDVFGTDLNSLALRRFKDKHFALSPRHAEITVDSREGIIYIKYNATFPYELHCLENAKKYLDRVFNIFKRNVNGKLAFNYREIVWDINCDFNYERDIPETPKFSPYGEFERPPIQRWEKASLILDKLFEHGYAVAVGGQAVGKTTLLRSFVIPQLLSVSPNVFYCDIWDTPVSEIKDIICRQHRQSGGSELDIASLCKKLLQDGPCFFILDHFERSIYLDAGEKEKLDRFTAFCIEQENIYLIISGDKEAFFEWYIPVSKMTMAAICEVKPIEVAKAIDAYGEEDIIHDAALKHKPIEWELLYKKMSIDEAIQDSLKEISEDRELRKIVAVFVDINERQLRRHSLEKIYFETAVPHKDILGYLSVLKEKDILTEVESTGHTYYVLSSRYLREPLHRALRLDDFEEKKKVRNTVKYSIINETFLDSAALETLGRWKDDLIFSKDEMGLILASLIAEKMDYAPFFEKAKTDYRGIHIQPILRLLHSDDSKKRQQAIKLLIEIQSKDMINPLLAHLKREDVFEIKELLIGGIAQTGSKRAIFAIMEILKETGDRQLKLRTLECFYSLFNVNDKDILIDIREIEKDSFVLKKIDGLLSGIGK